MRSLSPSEKRLLLIFCAVIFLVANFFILEQVAKQQRALKKTLTQLRLEQNEARAWLADAEWWTKRRTWLLENQPKPELSGQESASLLEFLQQSARQENITISQQRLKDPLSSATYREVSVQLEVKGRLDSVTRWLATLQSPEKFHAITSFTLKSDVEPPSVICVLTVARWYALPAL